MNKNKQNKIKNWVTMFSLMTIILFSLRANACPISEVFDTDFDSQVVSKMALAQIKTSTMTVINRTEVVFAKSYGEQSSLNLVYPLHSINKVLIGVATLQLVEEGLIDINADINSYLPYIIENPNFPDTPITCKNLLAHRAGINDRANITFLNTIQNSTIPFPDYIYDFLNVNGSLYDPNYWEYEPGEDYTYATLDFEILSYIIEIVTGTTILEYVQSNILDPLGMSNTKNSFFNYDISDIAIPYLWDPIASSTHPMELFDVGTSLTLKSTSNDLAKFLTDLMCGYSYGNSTLLNATSIQSYMFNHQGAGHGLGIFVNWEDKGWKGYLGNGPGYTSFMFFTEGIGVILFVNQGAFTTELTQDYDILSNIMQYFVYLMNHSLKINDICTIDDESSYYFALLPILLLSVYRFLSKLRKRD